MAYSEEQIKNMVESIRGEYSLVLTNNEDAIKAIEFVYNLIEADIEITKENESYATSHIKQMENVKRKIWDLQDYFEN